MPVVRRARAFTLIEVMIVVAIVGILAVVAGVAYRKWVLNSHIGEAQNMLGNIRSAEETFLAENGGYLNVSAGLNALYPVATPTGSLKTAWGAACGGACNIGSWAALNVNPNAPVMFGYAVVADNNNGAPPAVTNNGVAVDLTPMVGKPWYVATAVCDIDSNAATPQTTLYAVSGTNQIFMNNEGQ